MGGISAMVLLGGLAAALATAENDLFQFCTTKAYGWPVPWQMDYCECEGAVTVYPAVNALINVGSVLGGGLALGLAVGGVSWIRVGKNPPETP